MRSVGAVTIKRSTEIDRMGSAGAILIDILDVLRTEIIDIARGGEADPGGKGAKADRKIEIAVEQAMDHTRDERVSGADAVDDLYRVTR